MVKSLRLGSALLLLSAACGMEGELELELPTPGVAAATGQTPGVETQHHEINSSGESPMTEPSFVTNYMDCKGRVMTRLWWCMTTDSRDIHTGRCPVGDADFVAIGGGAWVVGGESFPGAALIDHHIADFNAKNAYRASSKAHTQSFPHRLIVYVLGLRIEGVSRAQLAANMQLEQRSVSASAAPEIWQNVPSGRLMVSGGIHVNWFQGATPGQMLVGSWGGGGTWGVKSKDHIVSDHLQVTAQLIHIPASIGGINLVSAERGATVDVGSGVATAEVNSGRIAVTSFAGWASYNGAGRVLFRQGPLTHDRNDYRIITQSKDHIFSDGGTTWVNAVGIAEKLNGPTRCVNPV